MVYMKQVIILYLFLQTFFSCSPKTSARSTVVKDSTPVCILKRIEEIKKQPVWSPPAEISEYGYNGQTVYLITADCCDQFIMLVNKECQVLCAPAGGFTGRGDEGCPDFFQRAKLLRVVWKDERGQ